MAHGWAWERKFSRFFIPPFSRARILPAGPVGDSSIKVDFFLFLPSPSPTFKSVNLISSLFPFPQSPETLLPLSPPATMSAVRKHNVTTFPRPPIVERINRHIQIKWHGQLLVDCPPGEAFWVLE